MGKYTEYKTESLQRLSNEKREEYNTLVASEDLSEEQIEAAEVLGDEIDEIQAELDARVEAASKVESLRNRFANEEAPEDEEEEDEEDSEEEEAPVEAAAEEESDEAEVVEETQPKAKSSSVEALANKTPRPKAPQSKPPVTITAGADVPDFSTGQVLELSDLGPALVSRMSSFGTPSGDGRSEQLTRYPVARFKMEFPEELTVKTQAEDLEVLNFASKESRLEGGSLTASGGWCTPSENLYDLCVTETLDGILSIPEINIARGGINFTKGPDFSSIYTNSGFLLTEAEAIAGTDKTCYEVPCPSWTDVRLDAIGLCIKAPILTNAAFPELIQRWIDGSMVAHAHKVNASVISRMVTLAGAAETVVDFSSTAHTTLSALELLANYKRQTYKLALGASMEVVLPYWVKSAIRDDLSLRTGQEPDAITDAQIQAHFAARHLNVQWVYDWQELDTSNATEGYAASYTALIYPAGTFVKGTSDVIKLDAVYDAASLVENIYTALFFEQGLLVANVCMDADLVTLPVFNSGRTGIANLSVSGIAVA